MFKNMENLTIEEIHKGVSQKRDSIIRRESNSFVLRTSGCVRYTFLDYFIDVHPGEIIFLPKDSNYDFTSLTDAPCGWISIRFNADFTDAQPFLCSIESFNEAEVLKNNLTDLWKFGGQAEHYKCYSIFYNLLEYMENLERLKIIDKKQLDIISPAISYLQKHIYDCDLKIEKLIQLCDISGTYFHTLFHAKYDTSPRKYILSKRLSQAKSIIDNGDFDTISEVAAAVGYNDPLYFSRAFKKKYGVSPSQYAKL